MTRKELAWQQAEEALERKDVQAYDEALNNVLSWLAEELPEGDEQAKLETILREKNWPTPSQLQEKLEFDELKAEG